MKISWLLKKFLQNSARKYYDKYSKKWINFYSKTYAGYPDQELRLKLIFNQLKKHKIKSIFDLGCGSGGTMIKLLKKNILLKVWIFWKRWLKKGKKNYKKMDLTQL